MDSNFKINLNKVDLIVYDFDGVMTDNKVITFEDGREAVVANRADGLGISLVRGKGIPQLIISTEANKVVKARAKKLGLPVLYNITDKKECLTKYCAENKYDLDRVVYIGNDVNDYDAMTIVGLPLCPVDAHPLIKKISKHVISKKGGEGVIREFADLLNG